MKRKNIVVLVSLLWSFFVIIPSISNLLHYVIINHNFEQRSSKLEWIDSKHIHYCAQYLCKFSAAIDIPSLSVVFIKLQFCTLFLGGNSANYKQQQKLFYWLRGPPFEFVKQFVFTIKSVQ